MAEIDLATRTLQLAIKGTVDQILARVPPAIMDPAGLPGPQVLKVGTLDLGYFGFTFASELIGGNALASQIGLSAGTAQHDDAGWLKWVKDGKIMFVARKTFRYNLSWDQIDAVGAVFGTKTVSIGGKTYKVRLLTGGNANPASAAGGEWNLIMYGAHNDEFPAWDTLSDCGLHVHSDCGNGSYSWCQEVSASDSASRVYRGLSGVANFNTSTSSNAYASSGWRPVLEPLL